MKKAIIGLSLLFTATLLFSAFRKDENHSGIYKIDLTKSGVTWIGKKVIGGHNGTIAVKEGSVHYNGTTITSGSFTIDMSTIKSLDLEGESKGKLEHHLMSPDFFDAAKYPVTTFIVEKVVPGSGNSATVTGALTIKDVTKNISFPITLTVMDDRLEVNAKDIKIDRTQYGVKFASKSLKSTMSNKAIDDEFTIGFSLVLTK